MFAIMRTRPQLPERTLEALRREDVATIHEAMGRRGAMNGTVKPLADGMKTCGPALTVKCHPGDNLMLIKAISMAQPGDVIVTDMGGLIHSGPFGEVLAVECVAKKVAGLIFSCMVRDSAAIKRLGLPVFSSGRCVEGTAKATLGAINHPVVCGGLVVNPGDVVLGDDDGVVAVPAAEAAATLQKATERREKEETVMARLRAGESLFDIYGYQAVLDSLHCREEDSGAES